MTITMKNPRLIGPVLIVLTALLLITGCGGSDIEKLKNSEDIDGLIKALNNFDVMMDAAEALADIGPPAVEPLIEALEHENGYYTRMSAAYALGLIGDSHVVEPLIAAHFFNDLLQSAEPLLDSAFELSVTDGSAGSPVLFLRNKNYYVDHDDEVVFRDYDETEWEIIWPEGSADTAAMNSPGVHSLLALRESLSFRGQYGRTGPHGYDRIWHMRLITWPDGEVVAEEIFRRQPPLVVTGVAT